MATGNYAVTGSDAANNPRFASGADDASVSEREQLANFISMITRDETPFMSSIGKTKAMGVYHEWQTDELVAPRNSRVVQGADFAAVRPDGDGGGDNAFSDNFADPGRTRLGNYTQINAKTVAVSNTKRAVDQAGLSDEYAYQLKKRGTEMRRDIEQDLIHSINTASGGSGSAAGTFGGVAAWINDERTVRFSSSLNSTNLAKYALPGGTGTQASAADPGVGTAAFFTTEDISVTERGELELEDIDFVMQDIYEEGGKATRVMVSPMNRRVFSAKAQAAGTGTSENVRRNIDDKGKLTQAVSIYMSDFGEVMIEPNYIMGLSNTVDVPDSVASADTNTLDLANFTAWIYDPSWFKIATLRPMQEVDVGQRGDSIVGMFVEECTLEVTNPIGCGAIHGLGLVGTQAS